MRLTAVICTRNRTTQLARALRSLLAQAQAPEAVLVIDNAPSDEGTRRLVTGEFPAVRYVCEPVEGLNAARNRALREAQTDALAYLDDDAVADAGWARAFRAALQDPAVAVATGRVEPLALETPSQRLFEANGGFDRGTRRVRLPEDANQPLHGRRAPLIAWAVSIGNGTSFAVKRDAVLALGGFDESLDQGHALPGGGDLDMFWRALQAGHRVVYEPDALARHEHRREPEALARQLAGHQRALVAFLCKSARRTRSAQRLPVLAFLAWRLCKPGARLVRRAVGQDPLPARLLWRMWGESVAGLWAYPAGARLAAVRRVAR